MAVTPINPNAERPADSSAGNPTTHVPLWLRRSAFMLIMLLAFVSVLVAVVVGFRTGSTLLSLTLVTAGVARMTLPKRYSLGFIVRSRRIDTFTYFGFAIAVFVSAWMVPVSRS